MLAESARHPVDIGVVLGGLAPQTPTGGGGGGGRPAPPPALAAGGYELLVISLAAMFALGTVPHFTATLFSIRSRRLKAALVPASS
jgi:hypothetical protein